MKNRKILIITRSVSLIFICLIAAPRGGCAAGEPDNQFVRVTNGPAVNDGGWSFGVSWVDFNNDSYPDLFICNEDFSGSPAPNYVYINNGDGTYSRLHDDETTFGAGCLGSTWADFDGDGDLDCYAARPFLNSNLLLINNGDGTFRKDSANGLTIAKNFSMEVEWMDYDKDGWLDMFVANHMRRDNPVYAEVYHNDSGVFQLMTNSDLGLMDDEANGMAWGDYNGDGLVDIFWSRNDKPSLLFANDGGGSFTRITDNRLIDGVGKYFGNWVDFDNDGDLDIYTESGDPGFVTLYKNAGNGKFELVTDDVFATDSGTWTGGYWGDYDNDGWLDLLVLGQKQYKGYPNRLYHNNADGTFSRVMDGPIASDNEPSAAAAWADHDRDGDLDLFIANVNNANNALYQNLGNDNHWIQIRLLGKNMNRSGIGAKIRVKAVLSGKPVWQMREIEAKNGFKSQSDLVAHFGLGNAARVDSLIVEWPDGYKQFQTNINADQFINIIAE